MGHGYGICTLPRWMETIDHILFHYHKFQRGWAGNAIYYEGDARLNYLTYANSIINIVNSCLNKTPISTTKIFVVYQKNWTLWKHKIYRVYNQTALRFSPKINVNLALAHLQAVMTYTTSYKKVPNEVG